MFYGVGAAVTGIIAMSVYKLTSQNIGRDKLLWPIYPVGASVTAVTASETVWVVLVAGLLVWLMRAPPGVRRGSGTTYSMASSRRPPLNSTQRYAYYMLQSKRGSEQSNCEQAGVDRLAATMSFRSKGHPWSGAATALLENSDQDCVTVPMDRTPIFARRSPAALDALLTFYHRAALLIGSSLLVLGWSRVVDVATRQHFARSTVLLAALSALCLLYQMYHQAPRETRALTLAWLAMCLYFALLVLWNDSYLAHIASSGYTDDIFRYALQTFQAPVYGVAKPLAVGGICIALMAGAMQYALSAHHLRHQMDQPQWRMTSGFVALQLFAISAYGLINNGGAWPSLTLIHANISLDLHHFDSVAAVWSQWNARLASLRSQAGHYPPALMALTMLERDHALPGLLALTSITSALACIPLMTRLCRTLELSPASCICALGLMAASPALFTFPPVAATAPTAMLTLASLVSLAAALRGQRFAALASGLALGCHGLYSFTAVFNGLLLALWLLAAALNHSATKHRVLVSGGQLMVGSIGLWSLVWAVADFNLLTCLTLAIENNRAAMSYELFEQSRRYVLRASGNLLAYCAYLGPLAACCALAGGTRSRPANARLAAFAMALGATLLLATLSGSFFLETERIWIFFTPAICVLAGYGLAAIAPVHGQRDQRALWLAGAMLAGWTMALAMTQHVPPDETINIQDAPALLMQRNAPPGVPTKP